MDWAYFIIQVSIIFMYKSSEHLKFERFANLKAPNTVNQPTNLYGHILDLILSCCDQDTIVGVKISDFISYHALVKCSIEFPRQVAHISNKVQYRRYNHINMSDFYSDLKNTSFVKYQLIP